MTGLKIDFYCLFVSRSIISRSSMLLVCLFGGSIAVSAQSYPAPWPSSGAWIGYTQLGTATQDLSTAGGDLTTGGTGVNPSSSDVFNGTAGNLISVYYTYDAVRQVLFFRMRLRGDPRASGGGAPLVNGTWDTLLDTDGDGYKELFIEVNGNDDVIYVYFGDVNQQNIPNASSCAGNGQGTVFSQAITLGTHVLVTDVTASGGGYLLDYQVPLSAFMNCSNVQVITPTTPFSLAFTTSATTQDPTQKDFVGLGDFTMAAGSPMPMGDVIVLSGPPDQSPRISGYSQTCGGGANGSPVTLTANTLDTLIATGAGASATVIDTIASVTFSYQPNGGSTWTQINSPVAAPVAGTLNKWSTSWNTSALASGTYWIKIVVVDDQGNTRTDISHGIDLSNCNSVTYVDFISFKAAQSSGGRAVIEWRTGYESDNLGFNLYRDANDKRVKLNPSLIAGSALKAGATLTAGLTYSWVDAQSRDQAGANYWLEAIDLNGHSSWNGPVTLSAGPRLAADSYEPNARLLSDLNSDQNGDAATRPVQRFPAPKLVTAAALVKQQAVASYSTIKITINRQGWYQVKAADVIAAGLDARVDSNLLQLFVDGREQPINVMTNKDGTLSSLDFYGTNLDNAYTNDRTYWLVVGTTAGKRIAKLTSPGNPATGGSYLATVERRDRTVYFSGLRNGERENFFGAVIARDSVEETLTLAHVDSRAVTAASLQVALQGVTNQAHSVNVEINGDYAGTITFANQTSAVNSFNVAHALLREGANTVRMTAIGGAGDTTLVDYLRLSYQHTNTADHDALLFTATGKQAVTIDGFSEPTIRVLDITDSNAVREVVGTVQPREKGFAVSLLAPGAGERTLLATASELLQPILVVANAPSSWRQPSNGADFIVITRKELAASLDPLVAHRRQQGLSVSVVDIEDVYDEFSFGQKTPQAVKDFLAYASTSWKKKPRYVLLGADASYDPKNYFGAGDSDLVPTKLIDTQYMETASDDWFVDFNNDGLPEMAIGRLPARTASEALTMAVKIVRYDLQPVAESLLLVSDVNDTYNFAAASAGLRALIPPDVRAQSLHRGDVDDATTRALLIEAINNGQRIVNYVGHGSVDLWRGNVLTGADVSSLTNGERLTVFVMMTCLNGYYHDVAMESLGESLLKSERGGAVAVWASSGMTLPEVQAAMNQEAYRQLFSGQGLTIGEAMMRAKAAVPNGDVRWTWVLLGDPATRLH